jgi:hypothetical protein
MPPKIERVKKKKVPNTGNVKRNQVKETFKGHVFEGKNVIMSVTSKLGDFDLLFDRAYHN